MRPAHRCLQSVSSAFATLPNAGWSFAPFCTPRVPRWWFRSSSEICPPDMEMSEMTTMARPRRARAAPGWSMTLARTLAAEAGGEAAGESGVREGRKRTPR